MNTQIDKLIEKINDSIRCDGEDFDGGSIITISFWGEEATELLSELEEIKKIDRLLNLIKNRAEIIKVNSERTHASNVSHNIGKIKASSTGIILAIDKFYKPQPPKEKK